MKNVIKEIQEEIKSVRGKNDFQNCCDVDEVCEIVERKLNGRFEQQVKPTLAEEEKEYLRDTLNLEMADAKIALTKMYEGKRHQLITKRIRIIESIISKCSL